MRIIVTKDYNDMSRKAANIISAQIITKPDCVLGLATGSSPVGAYKTLVDWYKKGDLDFSEVTTVNLDEYRGLTHSNDQSYYYFMNDNLFSHVNIDPAHTHIPDGTEPDAQKACDDFEAIVKNCGGTDLQLLGLGHNGHIGFNEPAEDFPKFTHCVDLTESTIQANARFFDKPEDVPTQAYTGNRHHYARKTDSVDCQWKRQSSHCKRSSLRTGSSSGTGFHPSASPGRNRCSG